MTLIDNEVAPTSEAPQSALVRDPAKRAPGAPRTVLSSIAEAVGNAVAATDRDDQSRITSEPLGPEAIRDPSVLSQLRRTEPRPRGRVLPRQEWVGRVEEVGADSFRATLRNTTTDDEPFQEHVELWLEEVTERDRDLVSPGAIFYWIVGYRDESYGQRSATSTIIFRRRVPLSDDERARASARAAELWEWMQQAPKPPE